MTGNHVDGFIRLKGSNPLLSVVISMTRWSSGLRHCPFTAVTWVRIPYGSFLWRVSSVGRASALQAEGHRFEPCTLHLNYWFHGLVGLGRLPVTQEITSSSLVGTVK